MNEPSLLPTTCALHAKALEELTTDVKQIKTALLGDDFGNRGYKQRLETVEQETDKLRRAMVRLDIRVTAIAATVSTAAFLIKHLIWK